MFIHIYIYIGCVVIISTEKPSCYQWAGTGPLTWVAKAKMGFFGAACVGEGKRERLCFAEWGPHLTVLRLSKQGAVWFADDPNKPAEKSLQVNPEQIILETFREKENPKALFCFRLNEVFHFKLEQLVCWRFLFAEQAWEGSNFKL